MSERLPVGWEYATGDELFTIVRGVTFKKGDASSERPEGKVAILRAGNLQEGRIVEEDLVYVDPRFVHSDQMLRKGDMVVAMSSGSASVVGKVAGIREHYDNISFGAFCATIRPRDKNVQDWLNHYFQTNAYRGLMSAMAAGVNINNLRPSHLEELEIPIPPSNEQRRIVAKIEALIARSARAKETLDAIPALLNRYRQSVLAAAFRGDLTADWRTHTMGTGANISECWKSSVVSDVADLVSGQTPKGVAEQVGAEGDVPWFKVADMNRAANQREMVEFDTFLTVSQAKQLGLKARPKGTVIFPKRGGAIATNKKRVLGRPAAFDLNIMGLIPKAVSSDYLWFWMLTVDLSKISDGSNVPQINNGDIAPLPIPVPSREEQHEICRLLADTFASIGTVEQAWKEASARLPKMNQSILVKAFRGKLVPQDPNDEPASALLARIKAERATTGTRAARGRRRTSSSEPALL